MVRSPGGSEEGVKKGPWTPEEDEKLIEYIKKKGLGSWRALPKLAGLNRCGKSCRLRWMNYLRPEIKRGNFTEEEENLIIDLHKVLGNKWSRIANHLPGRTDNEIKNFWNTHLRKKLLQRGIDPNTHKQRTDLNPLLNLPQLLIAAQSCFGINLATNPNSHLENIFNRLHNLADPTELAKIQLLQNLILLMNATPNLPPTLEHRNNILGSSSILESLSNLRNTLQSHESIPGLSYPNPFMNSNYNIYNNFLANNTSALGTGVGDGIKTENNQEQLPALVCPSSVEAPWGVDGVSDTKFLGSRPRSANVSNYSGDSFSSTDASSSHTSSIFADLENLMKDDSSASFLKDILK